MVRTKEEKTIYSLYAMKVSCIVGFLLGFLCLFGYFSYVTVFKRLIFGFLFFVFAYLSLIGRKRQILAMNLQNIGVNAKSFVTAGILGNILLFLLTLYCEWSTVFGQYIETEKSYFRGLTLLFLMIFLTGTFQSFKIEKLKSYDS